MALGYHLKVPVIGVSASALYPWGSGLIGNPANLAFVPNNFNDYIAPMTFWQRLHNTVTSIYYDKYFQYCTSSQDKVIKKYFGEGAPGVREAERNLALVIVNSHPALNGPKPSTPALIEAGGLHIQDDGPELPLVNCSSLLRRLSENRISCVSDYAIADTTVSIHITCKHILTRIARILAGSQKVDGRQHRGFRLFHTRLDGSHRNFSPGDNSSTLQIVRKNSSDKNLDESTRSRETFAWIAKEYSHVRVGVAVQSSQ